MGEERRGKREKIGEREEWEEKRKENRGKRRGLGEDVKVRKKKRGGGCEKVEENRGEERKGEGKTEGEENKNRAKREEEVRGVDPDTRFDPAS